MIPRKVSKSSTFEKNEKKKNVPEITFEKKRIVYEPNETECVCVRGYSVYIYSYTVCILSHNF